MMFSHPGIYCVVAETDGRIVGSNFLDERSPIAGVGPITVVPGGQNRGVGGRLMQTALSTLTLEVYYRHLPLYRRDMGVMKAEAK